MGHDTYFDLLNGKWKGGERIFDEVRHLYVINREGEVRATKKPNGTNFNKINSKVNIGKVVHINIKELTDISSSKIRKQFSDLKKLLSNKKNLKEKLSLANENNINSINKSKLSNTNKLELSNINKGITNIYENLILGLYYKVFQYIMDNVDVYEYYTK